MDDGMRLEGWEDLTPQQRETLPTFFVIGAMKAGSTSMYQLLKQHPEVYMSPVKEPAYFAVAGGKLDDILPRRAQTSVRTLPAYLELFESVGSERAIGEASPIYMYFPWVPHRIRDVIANPRFIAILRNPADRAFSHYVWARAHGDESTKTFAEAVDTEVAGKAGGPKGLGFVGPGFYGRHLATYFELFDPSQLLVVIQDDLARDPAGTLRSVYAFLEVDPTFGVGETTVYNERLPVLRSRRLASVTEGRSRFTTLINRVVPSRLERRALKALRRWNQVNIEYPDDVRRKLIDLYADDIRLLERLTNRNLSIWLD